VVLEGCGGALNRPDLRRSIGVDDENRNDAVVQDVVADAAEQGCAERAAATGAHHDEVVMTVFDLVGQRNPDRLVLAGW
jgi:hypothetical protein